MVRKLTCGNVHRRSVDFVGRRSVDMDVDAEQHPIRVTLKRNIDDVYSVSTMWNWYVVKITDIKDGRRFVIVKVINVCSRMNTTKACFLTSDRKAVGYFCGKTSVER